MRNEATETLMTMGVEVLVIDSTTTAPTDVARRIADALPAGGGSVHSNPHSPDEHTVNP